MAGLLGVLTWLDLLDGAIFLIPPFAATLTILVYLPHTPIAQPVAVICGSVFGAATGTVLSLVLGSGAGVAMLAALAAMMCCHCCGPFIRQESLWRCVPPCCTSDHGSRLRSSCHSH
jgi:CBS domain-containing membrane protein